MFHPGIVTGGGVPHKICRHYSDLSGELEKFYTVVSKIHSLTYRKLVILPIKLGKVCQGLETEPFEFQIMVFRPWFLV